MVSLATLPGVVESLAGGVGGVAPAAGLRLAAAGQAEAGISYTPFLPGLILLLPLLGAAINGIGAFAWRESRRIPTLVGPLAVLASFAIVAANFLSMRGAGVDDPILVSLWTWIAAGDLRVGVDLQLDHLSLLMGLIVTGVGGIIHVYSVGYMREDPGYSRFFAYLNLFVFFMLLLVLGANFPLMFVGWEGVGLCSYLLIGFWYEVRAYSDAGKKAFIVNRVGDAGFLVAIFLLFNAFGTLDFLPILSRAPGELAYGGPLATWITLLLFVGCTGKSAQIPLHVWLPDAMAGPTPVSALIHAATMVTAGVYLVARTGVLFALAPVSQAVVAAVGAGTALFAATIALQQVDIKRVLAYSTISQLGYMFLAVGIGAFTAGIFHLMTHAFFKALLFLGAGAVIHRVEHAWHGLGHHGDPNDMRNHGGLASPMPITAATMWIATLAIAGVFPFAGFFSKDEILWRAGAYGYPILWAVGLVTAVLTAVYMTRLMVLTFHGRNRTFAEIAGGTGVDPSATTPVPSEDAGRRLHEAPPVMWVPLVLLAALALVGGWVNVPEALPLPGVEALHHWLEPVFEPARRVAAGHGFEPGHRAPLGGGEGAWALISTLLAAATVGVTLLFLKERRCPTPSRAAEPRGVARFLYRKWYVDELYDRAIVRPLLTVWRACWRVVDARLVDGSVNGVAGTSSIVGWLGSQLQSGRVGTYLFFFVVGAVFILGTLAF
ncbi:MAG: NADH-quinone oxidoreductase subunit L [Gemmatimonadota bacterium]